MAKLDESLRRIEAEPIAKNAYTARDQSVDSFIRGISGVANQVFNKQFQDSVQEEAETKRKYDRLKSLSYQNSIFEYKTAALSHQGSFDDAKKVARSQVPEEFLQDPEFSLMIDSADSYVQAKREEAASKNLGINEKRAEESLLKNFATNIVQGGDYDKLDDQIDMLADVGITEKKRQSIYADVIKQTNDLEALKKFWANHDFEDGMGKGNALLLNEDTAEILNSKLSQLEQRATVAREAVKKQDMNFVISGNYDAISPVGQAEMKAQIEYAKKIRLNQLTPEQMKAMLVVGKNWQKDLLQSALVAFEDDYSQDFIYADEKRGIVNNAPPVVLNLSDTQASTQSLGDRLDYFYNQEIPFWKNSQAVRQPLTQEERANFELYFNGLGRQQQMNMVENFSKQYSDSIGYQMLSTFLPHSNIGHNMRYNDMLKNDFVKANNIDAPSGRMEEQLLKTGNLFLGSDIAMNKEAYKTARQMVANHILQGKNAKADEFSRDMAEQGYNALFDNYILNDKKYTFLKSQSGDTNAIINRKLRATMDYAAPNGVSGKSLYEYMQENRCELEQIDFGSFRITTVSTARNNKGVFYVSDTAGKPLVINIL